jgi:hypothetical protein
VLGYSILSIVERIIKSEEPFGPVVRQANDAQDAIRSVQDCFLEDLHLISPRIDNNNLTPHVVLLAIEI